MPLRLSSVNLDSPTQRVAWDPNGHFELSLVGDKSRGYYRETWLRPGLSFGEECFELAEDLEMEHHRSGDPFYCLEISFTIRGYNHTESIELGTNFLHVGWREPSFKQFYLWHQGQSVHKFDLFLTPKLIRAWILNQCGGIPAEILTATEQMGSYSLEHNYWQKTVTTPEMQRVIQQIVQCPYHSLTRRLYQESRALELLALRLEQTLPAQVKERRLTAEDIERVRWAQQILLQDVLDPPDLQTLARQVGLNDFKLKQGFREVFGTTVFGCLQAHRLDQAEQMLKGSQLSVEMIAQRVGYASRNAFARAFQRRFGSNPKTYQLSHRRT